MVFNNLSSFFIFFIFKSSGSVSAVGGLVAGRNSGIMIKISLVPQPRSQGLSSSPGNEVDPSFANSACEFPRNDLVKIRRDWNISDHEWDAWAAFSF